MASSSSTMLSFALLVSISLSLLIPSALAGVICEELPQDLCAFAVSSSAKRCVLESYQKQKQGKVDTEYQCSTSEEVVQRISNHIETDQCVKSCGVDRHSVGISSDSLLEPQFTAKLCSPDCYQNCPNIIDLYFNLAAGEAKRCVLESYQKQKQGKVDTEYQCSTSEEVVQRISNHIETDQCVKSCGVDRHSVGISSDSLLEPQFTAKLCSPDCYQNCPNIIDLYFNLAAGEGVFLPDLCQARRSNPHRAMAELLLSSGAAPSPISGSGEEIHTKLDASESPAPAPIAA